jgi:hypothetical protein
LKKVTAILFLLIFCVQAFSFKTHYCYHHDGTRFHGDCGEHIREIEKGNGHHLPVVHEQKYICHDVQLEKQFHQQDYSFKSFSEYLFDLPVVETVPPVIFQTDKPQLTVFSCRGGPPPVTKFLRGPPLV